MVPTCSSALDSHPFSHFAHRDTPTTGVFTSAHCRLPASPPMPLSLASAEQHALLWTSDQETACTQEKEGADYLLSCSTPQRAYNNSLNSQAQFAKHCNHPAQSLSRPRQPEMATGYWTDKTKAQREKHSTQGSTAQKELYV